MSKPKDIPELDELSEIVSFILVGDIHFQHRKEVQALEFAEKCTAAIKKKSPDFIVLLGDILHEHNRSNVQIFNIAMEFIKNLTNIAHVYVIMGNHDLMNSRQFLTSNHFFNPIKEWPHAVTIVDEPVIGTISTKRFLFLPYVPPGTLEKALDGIDMDDITAVFSHLEIKGVLNESNQPSINGDPWPSNYPVLFSGHYHNDQMVGKNVYYPGSSTQVKSGDGEKKIWYVTLEDDEFQIDKINIGLKQNRIIRTDLEKINELDIPSLINKYHLKLEIECSYESYKVFIKSKKCLELKKSNVMLAHIPLVSTDDTNKENDSTTHSSFSDVLEKMVNDTKDENVEYAYSIVNDMLQGENEEVELVFE